MTKTTISAACAVFAVISPLNQAMAHCQVPCGIYADDTVFDRMAKDVETIQKAMKMLADPALSINQKVRWVQNKESHAQSIQDTVARYFLAQRIKLSEQQANGAKYAKKLSLLHKITVLAMQCKQTIEPVNGTNLGQAIADFKKLYLTK